MQICDIQPGELCSAQSTGKKNALSHFVGFLDRLRNFRVLDPACGSGNFLYVALLALKDIEHKANIEAELLRLPRQTPSVGPEAVLGIEINPFAAELARVSVWIGEIQWMRRNGFGVADRPILKPLENIECRDAILNSDGSETSWPNADVLRCFLNSLFGCWLSTKKRQQCSEPEQ